MDEALALGQFRINPSNWERFLRETPRSPHFEDRRSGDSPISAEEWAAWAKTHPERNPMRNYRKEYK